MASQLALLLFIFLMTYSAHGYSKYGRTCADIGCPSAEVCVMAEDPCTYGRRDECGSYPTCQRRTNVVKSCDNFVCPPTMYCRLDGDTPKCIPDGGPLGGRNGNPNANVDPHNLNNGGSGERHQPNAPLYPQIPVRGQTTTRPPVYRHNNGGTGGYQGGSVGSGYPGNGGGGYGGGSIGGGYPGGYSGYPSNTNNNRYPGYSGYPSSGGGYPSNGYNGYNGHANTNNYPYNTNPYYSNNYGNNAATTPSPLYEGLKNLGIFCFMLHTLVAHARQL